MKKLFCILTALLLLSCTQSTNNIDKAYQNKLNETKQYYPFAKWREAYDHGLDQYTQENCDKAKKIYDDLIKGLVNIGEKASEKEKIEVFKIAILATNKLPRNLIETGEAEDLIDLTDKITIACGLEPKKYGWGEGLASEWREW